MKLKLSENSINEAYCLISAYLREDKIGATYNKDYLQDFIHVLHDILKNDTLFAPVVLDKPEEE